MADPTSVTKEGIKVLGPGAYLVTAFPSVVLVLTLFGLISSRLYPFMDQIHGHGKSPDVEPGVASILYTARSLGIAGAVVLAVAVLCAAVLLRPLQISLVQLLEGYWGSRGRPGLIEALAVERHLRRRTRSLARLDIVRTGSRKHGFADVAAHARVEHHLDRIERRAIQSLGRYPLHADHVMPTALGNVLRRAETVAGERYGLSTVNTYPRLYPHLSARLEGEIANQLDTLDTTATFTALFVLQSVMGAPLLLRLDWWSAVPVAFALLALVAYVGAVKAAGRHGQLLEVAFDLHRFDMIAAMRLELPEDPERERQRNEVLSAFLAGALHPQGLKPPAQWKYQHPAPAAAGCASSTEAQENVPGKLGEDTGKGSDPRGDGPPEDSSSGADQKPQVDNPCLDAPEGTPSGN